MVERILPSDGHVFRSKRNKVSFSRSKGTVVKVFDEPESFRNEKKQYLQLAETDLKIPKLVGWDNETMTLELSYLQGVHVLSHLEMLESQGNLDGAVGLMSRVLDWLQGFYEKTEGLGHPVVFGDVNLRNFILVDDEVYGFDFEGVTTGNADYERCMVLAIYQLYDPADTAFKNQVIARLRAEALGDLTEVQYKGAMVQCRGQLLERRLQKDYLAQ